MKKRKLPPNSRDDMRETLTFVCRVEISYSNENARKRAVTAAEDLVKEGPSITGNCSEGFYGAIMRGTVGQQ